MRFLSFDQTEFANGWDAYFYLVQLKSMVEEGAMHSPENALIYPFLKIIYRIAGDFVLSFKIGAALLAAGFTVMAFLVGRKWSGTVAVGALLGAFFVFSPHLTYFAAQYPKNLLGMVLFLVLLYVWTHPLKIEGPAALIINYFGHKLTFGLSLIYVFLFLVVTRMRKSRIAVWSGVSVLLVGVILLCLGIISFPGQGRFEGMLTPVPHLSHISFNKSFGPELISVWWLFEVWLSLFLFALVLVAASLQYFLVNRSEPRTWTLLAISAFLIFPYWAWSLTGFSYRFFLVYVLIAPFLLTFFNRIPAKTAYFCALALIFLGLFAWRSYNPEIHDPPYEEYQRISVNTLEALEGKSPELVIAHNSLAEYFTFTTGIDGMPWRPDYYIPEDKLWRLATGVKGQMFSYYLPEFENLSIEKVTGRYFLVREDVWQQFLKAVEADDIELYDALMTWKNPWRVRPGFLGNKKIPNSK